MMHPCPAPECEASVPADQLACRPHWYSLPADVRAAVWRAWRRRGVDPAAHRRVVAEAVALLRDRAR